MGNENVSKEESQRCWEEQEAGLRRMILWHSADLSRFRQHLPVRSGISENKNGDGMDSSNGGPLSNLILVLPLIVVPALAILRPAERDSGLVNSDVSAEDDDFLSDPDDFDSIFGPQDGSKDETDSAVELRDEPHSTPSDFGFEIDDEALLKSDDDHKRHRDNTDHEHAEGMHDNRPESPGSGPILKSPNLTRFGVTKSVWFRPGGKRIGLAVFLPGLSNDVRYRFSAIGESEDQVLQNVIHQIRKWQDNQRRMSAGPGPKP